MGVTLPAAPWRDRPGLARLMRALGPDHARVVGGAVRDTLLGVETSDVDLATTHDPETVIALLEAVRIRAIPTGLQHGTITAVADDEVYEVTTLRRDLATDGRHATVAFTDDWREDAGRRDFTINALYADPATGAVFDYFGGVADLDVGHVRFIGDALTRIAEDHLRILRYFRFLARFGDVPDPVALDACTTRANDLMALSRERIASELLRLLIAPRAVEVVDLMIARGIFAPVLPEITDARRMAEVAAGEDGVVPPDAIRRLAALLPDRDAAEAVGARLKLSKAQRARLIAAWTFVTAPTRELVYRLGREGAVDQLLLNPAIDPAHRADIERIADMDIPHFPVKGGQLVARGLSAGPDVARTLHRIEDRWIAEGFPEGDRLSTITAEEVDQALVARRNA